MKRGFFVIFLALAAFWPLRTPTASAQPPLAQTQSVAAPGQSPAAAPAKPSEAPSNSSQNAAPSPDLPDLEDFSLLTFKIKGVQVSETFEAKSFLGASNTFTAPDGTKYYSVELVGHLDGLHKKYHFVCFNSKRFLAIPDSAKGAQTKASYQGEAISTDFFGTVPDSYCGIPFGGGADEWHFTVVFVLPSGLKKFAIGVVDPKGQPVYTGAVVDLTPAPPAKARAPSH